MFKEMGPSVAKQWKLYITIAQKLFICRYQSNLNGTREECSVPSLVWFFFFFCHSLVCHLFKYHCIALDFCKTLLSPSVLSN